MGTWTSLVVLSLAAVSTLSFPHPDEYKIPNVGLGSRAQYYVLHSDGSYKYGYDTGDGIYEQSMAQQPGEVSGGFGYKDPTGADIKLEYTADDRGFIATGAHLPVAPEVLTAEAGGSAPVPVHSVYSTDSHHSAFPPAPSFVAIHSGPVEVANVRSSASDDGSYSFAYKTDTSSRAESGDAHNSVSGTYSFVADDGVDRSINYIAGAETGYIAEGDSLPVGPPVPGAESGIPTGRILPVFSEDEANAFAAASSGSSARIGSADKHYSSSGQGSFTPAVATYSSGGSSASGSPSDGSYSFKYDAGDSSRSETADSNLNVQGSYSFLPPDTQHELTVNYKAGASIGFVAEGDHLPVAPEAPAAEAGGNAPVPVHSVYSTDNRHSSSGQASFTPAVATYSSGDSSASGSPSDGSYSFKYDAGDSSRSETADSNLNVQGSYSFLPPDTQHELTVNYRAGASTGFVAEGDHLPVAPVAEAGGSAPVPVHSVYSTDNHHSASPSAPSHYSGPVEVANVRSSASDDGSYSFAYKTDTSSRAESGDAHNSVSGTYSFVADDGVDRSINYIAGAETGYIAEGDSLPVGPPVPGAESGIPTGRILPVFSEDEANAFAAASSGSSARIGSADKHYSSSGQGSFTPAVATYSSGGSSASGSPSDGSYSFKYDAGDSSRSETADSNLNVQGSYSFLPPDTQHELTVNYRAGASTGFVAEGDHLPVAPEATVEPGTSGVPSSAHTVKTKSSGVGFAQENVPHISPPKLKPVPVSYKSQLWTSPSGHSSHNVGDVLLHQYAAPGSNKYGYVFTAVRR